MKLIYLIIFCMFFNSCLYIKPNNSIIIMGNIKNLPASKVYLTNVYNWNVFLDSANYNNDTFSFHVNPKGFEPYVASIYFISGGKREALPFQNYILSTDSIQYKTTAFVLEKGITNISGRYIVHPTKKTNGLKIAGSKQQIPFFRTQLLNFGSISTGNKAERGRLINNYKNLIKQYPYSYYFIMQLYNYRLQYSKEELKDMLSLFHGTGEMQYFKRKFYKYFNQLPKPHTPLQNYGFEDSLNQPKNITSSSSKLNMLIFWASWCGPCRQEIPKLKQIHSEFQNKGLNMVSISIDENHDAWRSLLRKEDMGWEQLIIDSLLPEEIANNFHFDAIPLIIFANSEGIELGRFEGYDSVNKNKYEHFIEKYLRKNK